MKKYRRILHRDLLLPLLLIGLTYSAARAQSDLPKYQPLVGALAADEGAWQNIRESGLIVAFRELELVPKAEPKPALSVQLIPNEFDLKEGNAAVFYLQAMGFFEQRNALQAKTEFEQMNRQAAEAEGKDISDFPPHVWRERTRPKDLPLEEVKKYLQFTSFQPRYLAQAVQRRSCDFDRHIRDVENPVGYLLPEIQSMRELARLQSLRFLVAMAEDRVEDAVAIFGQQLAMSPHLAQEPFLVSNLVGIACASIGLHDAYYLCEHAAAPNLYWALAALPQPLTDMRPALAYEREFLFEQFKAMREVDETPRSNLYWSRFLESFQTATADFGRNDIPFVNLGKSGMTLAVAAGVPGARRYLHEVEGLSLEQLDSLPNTQVFFLAARRYHEHVRDEMFKWQYVPEWERNHISEKLDRWLREQSREYGLIAYPSTLLMTSVNAAMSAQSRQSQQLAFLQTVEAIRHHLAKHDRQLPSTLSELELPAPNDPGTGQPFKYVRHREGATLSGSPWTGYRLQFELRVAK